MFLSLMSPFSIISADAANDVFDVDVTDVSDLSVPLFAIENQVVHGVLSIVIVRIFSLVTTGKHGKRPSNLKLSYLSEGLDAEK